MTFVLADWIMEPTTWMKSRSSITIPVWPLLFDEEAKRLRAVAALEAEERHDHRHAAAIGFISLRT
jgi:hypothetical protein